MSVCFFIFRILRDSDTIYETIEKKAEKLDETHYRVIVYYDRKDETEMVIRILSFGPMVRVVEPNHFVELMKKRLMQQREYIN